MRLDLTGNFHQIPLETNTQPPGRKVQAFEVAAFLFLIVPSLSTSFLIGDAAGVGFITGAIFSILNDLGLMGLVFYFVWRNGEPLHALGWSRRDLNKNVGWGLTLYLPIMVSTNFLVSKLNSIGLSAPSKLPDFLVAKGHGSIILAVILVIVVAVVEETIFRGYLIMRLQSVTRSPLAAVLLSAAVFSIGHGYEGLAGVVSIFFLGLVLGIVYLWRRSLVAPMTIHFLIDFVSIVLAAVLQGGAGQ